MTENNALEANKASEAKIDLLLSKFTAVYIRRTKRNEITICAYEEYNTCKRRRKAYGRGLTVQQALAKALGDKG